MTTTWGFSDGQMAALSTSDEDCDRMITMARACGVTVWRIPADWAACEPSPTQRNWVSVDRQISRLKNAGITPLIVIGGTRPKYSQFSQFGFGTDIGPTEFAAFCTDVATRYGTTTGPYGKVCTDFEIWTDPNNGGSWGDVVNAATYVSYLQAAYTAIKAVTGLSGASSRVVFGGTQHVTTVDSTWLTQSETDFVTAAYTAGAYGYFDVMGVHPFTDVDGLTAPSNTSPALLGSDAIHALMVANGDGAKPIWWTAFGYSTSDFTPANQATYISTMFTLAATRTYVQRMFVQALVDTSADPQNRTGNYGVVAVDWSLKPAYGYLQALNPYYRTATMTGHGSFTGPGVGMVIGGALSGAGAFLGSGAIIIPAAGTLAGSGAFSATRFVQFQVSGTLTGHGSFSGFEASSGRAGTLTGAGGFTATGKARYTRSGAISGAGGFAGTALVRRAASGTLSGSGAFTSAVTSRTATTATITGHGSFSGSRTGYVMPTSLTTTTPSSGGFSSTRSPATGTFTAPSGGFLANDLVVLVANCTGTSGTIGITLPSGWFNLLGGTTTVVAGVSNNLVAVAHWITAAEVTAGTTAWTLTNLFDAAQNGRRGSFVFRGVNTSSPVGAVQTAVSSTSNTVMQFPNLTPTQSLSLTMLTGGIPPFSTSEGTSSLTSPWVDLGSTYSTGGTSRTIVIGYNGTANVAGSTVTGPALTITKTDNWATLMVELKPAAL